MSHIARTAFAVPAVAVACIGVIMANDWGLDWHTTDGGGASLCTGGDFELSGTIAQPDAGLMSGGIYRLTGGFWSRQLPGDLDGDGDVDLFDYTTFQGCFTGPDGGPVAPQCAAGDFDWDNDIDLLDFRGFQAAFTGKL